LKVKIIILITALVIITAMCWLGYMLFPSAELKENFYEFVGKNSENRLSLLPERIELGTNLKPGYKVHFLDYSLTISGYKDVTIKNNDYTSFYFIGTDKFISFTDTDYLKDVLIINDPTLSSFIEKAVGKKIDNQYDFLEASFYCTPEDFSMFDVNKNKGVVVLLVAKEINTCDICYQFDNGVVKGFVCIMPPHGILVYFSNCKDPYSYYQLIYVGFSMEEVKEMLGTITFDGSDTAQ
jgi:hypothetical protein